MAETIDKNRSLELGDEQRVPLTRKKVLEILGTKDFPEFSKYEDFLKSDFFKEHYDLGTGDLRAWWMWSIKDEQYTKVYKKKNGDIVTCGLQLQDGPKLPHMGACDDTDIAQIYALIASKKPGTLENMRLQKMLIILGYIEKNSLLSNSFSSEYFSETNIPEEIDETDVTIWGILGNNDKRAIIIFQKDAQIEIDGILGPQTKEFLYKKVYNLFHKASLEDIYKNLKTLKNDIAD